MATALLFERDAVEELDGWEDTLPRVGPSSVLWVDLESPDENEIGHLDEVLDLASDTKACLVNPRERARVRDWI